MLLPVVQMSLRRARETGMAVLIDQWRSAGTAATTFAREHGVSVSTLFRWRRRLAAATPEALTRPPDAGHLVPVRLVSALEESAPAMEVTLTTGDRIRIGSGITPETLRVVVQVLRSAC
jgi:transposase-like protein